MSRREASAAIVTDEQDTEVASPVLSMTSWAVMSKRLLVVPLAILAVTSCGVDYSKRSYERVAPAAKAEGSEGQERFTLHVGANAKDKMKVGPPYTAFVSRMGSTAFTVTSLSYEHEGVQVVAHAASSPPIEATTRSPPADKKKRWQVRVPLADLKWVAGSTVDLRAEVLLPWATKPGVVETTLEAKKEERHYSCGEYLSLF